MFQGDQGSAVDPAGLEEALCREEGGEDEGEISGLVQYLFIETTKGKDCTKELLLHSNWIVDSEHVSKIPSNYKHTYTLNLGNADF